MLKMLLKHYSLYNMHMQTCRCNLTKLGAWEGWTDSMLWIFFNDCIDCSHGWSCHDHLSSFASMQCIDHSKQTDTWVASDSWCSLRLGCTATLMLNWLSWRQASSSFFIIESSASQALSWNCSQANNVICDAQIRPPDLIRLQKPIERLTALELGPNCALQGLMYCSESRQGRVTDD